MDMGAGMIVVMVLMMSGMVGLVGAGMWASRRRSRRAEGDSSAEDSDRGHEM